jgi:RHS repeat-associated protein
VVQLEDTYGLQWISEKQVISGTWTPSFYGYDGGGSVRQLTNAAGTVTDTYNYDAFGNLLNSTGSTPNNYLYRGEQFDPSLNLHYLRARYYNPAIGRFMGRDPFGGYLDEPATLQKYLYTGSDPVNWVDPSGRDTIELTLIDKIVILGVASGATAVAATHTTTNSGALGALGITVACGIWSNATKLSANVDLAVEYNGNGEVFQVGDCTWSYKGSSPNKKPPKRSPKAQPPTNPPQQPPDPPPPGCGIRGMPGPSPAYPDYYPNGYWILYKLMANGGQQPLDPRTMRPSPNPCDTHVPFP